MTQDSLTDMHRYSTHKDKKHRHPFIVFKERGQERFAFTTEAKDGESQVAGSAEDDDNRDPKIEGGVVVVVQVENVPALDEVVQDSQRPCGGNGVVGTDIGHQGEFRGEWNARTKELAEERCAGEETKIRRETKRGRIALLTWDHGGTSL